MAWRAGSESWKPGGGCAHGLLAAFSRGAGAVLHGVNWLGEEVERQQARQIVGSLRVKVAFRAGTLGEGCPRERGL